MKIHPQHFELIESGKKDIEIRLYDEKRKEIKVGDIITFLKRLDFTEKIKVEVVDISTYKSFDELFDAIVLDRVGGMSKEELLTDLQTFYSPENEKKYGVLAIHFKKL